MSGLQSLLVEAKGIFYIGTGISAVLNFSQAGGSSRMKKARSMVVMLYEKRIDYTS